MKDVLGEGSLGFAQFLHTVAKQLVNENKMKRAYAMMRHALSIFEDSSHPKLASGLGQVDVLSLMATLCLTSMKLESSLQASGQALLLCKNLLWPHTTGETTDYHLHHLWTQERLAATHMPSKLLTAIHSSMPVENAKLKTYTARRVARAAVGAFIAHSRAVTASNLQLGMNSAANALLCSHFATAGQGAIGTLAWCQVCSCATMRFLEKQGHRWRLLVPWAPQPALSHHTLIQCVCAHVAPMPGLSNFLSAVLQTEVECDMGLPHDETEAIFLQLLKEVSCKGVKSLSIACLKQLFKRCLLNLGRHRQYHQDTYMQMKVLFAYLLVVEVCDFFPCIKFATSL